MKLNSLKPRLQASSLTRLPTLEAKAGTTPRIRGRAWTETRKAVLLEHGYACVDCGRVSLTNEIDHDVPLEQGGSNARANLMPRCTDCHKAKTAREASARAGKLW
jgi:5-methylcytosine-specific restriction protein A